MRSYDSFAAWFKDQPIGQKRIISKLQKLVLKISPNLIESSKWTNGVWLKGDLPIIFIHTEPDHIQFGFFAGAMLTDPKSILQGQGKYIRHIRIDKLSDINEKALATMIRKAIKAPSYKQ